jgi:antitoxin component YwqK of YwqJK toxin-antitoxin module
MQAQIESDSDIRVTGSQGSSGKQGKWETRIRTVDASGKEVWKLTVVENYKRGEHHGRYIEFSLTGDTVEVGSFRNGMRSGEWRKYKGKQLISVEQFDINGRQVGVKLKYSPEGVLLLREKYLSPGVRMQWLYSTKGRLFSKGIIAREQRDKGWFEYDTLIATRTSVDTMPIYFCEYLEGIKHGDERKFHLGKLTYETSYSLGLENGDHIEYSNGVVILKEKYLYGKLYGRSRRYTADGKLYSDRCYYGSLPDSQHTVRDSITFKLIEESYYERGLVINLKKYNANEEIIFDQHVVDRDSLLYSMEEFFDGGKPKTTGRLVGKRRTGSYETWYSNGKRKLQTRFRNDQYDSKLEIWNEAGVLVFRSYPYNSRDTVPEQIWSDAGVKLQFGTKAYEAQRLKYLPSDLFPFYNEILNYGKVTFTGIIPPTSAISFATYFASSGYNMTFTTVEQPALFPGGYEEMMNFFAQRANIPDSLRKPTEPIKTILLFTVLPDSTIGSVAVFQSATHEYDMEGVRMLRAMPKWKPALRKGAPVESGYWIEFIWEVREP